MCGGSRLKGEALQFRIDDKNIAELSTMDIDRLAEWLVGVEDRMGAKEAAIAREVLKEIRERLKFMK